MSALGSEGSESLNRTCLFAGVKDGATAAGAGEGPKTKLTQLSPTDFPKKETRAREAY